MRYCINLPTIPAGFVNLTFAYYVFAFLVKIIVWHTLQSAHLNGRKSAYADSVKWLYNMVILLPRITRYCRGLTCIDTPAGIIPVCGLQYHCSLAVIIHTF